VACTYSKPNLVSGSLSLLLSFRRPQFRHAGRLALHILNSPRPRVPAGAMKKRPGSLSLIKLVGTIFRAPCHSSLPSQRPQEFRAPHRQVPGTHFLFMSKIQDTIFLLVPWRNVFDIRVLYSWWKLIFGILVTPPLPFPKALVPSTPTRHASRLALYILNSLGSPLSAGTMKKRP